MDRDEVLVAVSSPVRVEESVRQMVPIIVDMGKVRRGKARQIAEGKGPVRDDIERAVRYARAGLDPSQDLLVVPLVIVYEKKRKKRKRRGSGCFPA